MLQTTHKKLLCQRNSINASTILDYNTGDWQVALANTMRTLEECRYFPFNYKQTIGKGACQVVFLLICKAYGTISHQQAK